MVPVFATSPADCIFQEFKVLEKTAACTLLVPAVILPQVNVVSPPAAILYAYPIKFPSPVDGPVINIEVNPDGTVGAVPPD